MQDPFYSRNCSPLGRTVEQISQNSNDGTRCHPVSLRGWVLGSCRAPAKAVPDPDRCLRFRCGPVRSDADDVQEVRDVRAAVHDPDGVRDGQAVDPNLHHRTPHEHALARHPYGSFYH